MDKLIRTIEEEKYGTGVFVDIIDHSVLFRR